MSAVTRESFVPGAIFAVTGAGNGELLWPRRWDPSDEGCVIEVAKLELGRTVTLVSGLFRCTARPNPPATAWEVCLVTDRGACGWLRFWDSEVTEVPLIVPS